MNISKQSITDFYHKHIFAIGVFLVLFGFFFSAGGLVVANGQTMGPDDSHIVHLYDNETESTVPTRAATVGEFLRKAHVVLNEGDISEPSTTTPIDADNFRVQIYRARPVTIVDGAKITRVLTPQTSPQLIAEKSGITVYPEDKLSLSTADNFVQDSIIGQKLTINRATPASLSLYGAPAATYRTHANTVGELLAEKGIKPETGATVTPAEATPLSENMAIYISKYGKQVITVDEPIAFETETSNDPEKTIGTVTVTTAGVAGKKQVVYEVSTRDGKETGRVKINEVVTAQPVKQVQVKGTKAPTVVAGDKTAWMAAAGISPSDYFYVDYVVGREGGWNGVTKSNYGGSGAYGLCQALPGSKMASAGADWATNPITQLKWCNSYAVGRYGSWAGAYNAWLRQNWW